MRTDFAQVMATGVIFASLVVAAGLGIARGLRLPWWAAAACGLASLAVVGVWLATFGLLWPVGSVGLVALAIASVALGVRRPSRLKTGWRRGLLLAAACAVPIALLGVAFAGLEVPLSTHDGAFHVETIEALRRGVRPDTWYPIGFHALAAAMLGLVPWLDTARGAPEVALGLAVLAPVAVYGLARAFHFGNATATVAAAVVGLTWIYPYDYHVWDGWPQGMGVLLVLGVWMAALGWLRAPGVRWAVLVGVLGAALLLTHGIDLYSAALGLMVLAFVEWRCVDVKQLVWHAPVGLCIAALGSAPYLRTLFGWAQAGGAVDAAAQVVASAPSDDVLLQFAIGITGAGSLLDLPVRAALVLVGIIVAWRRHRALVALWAAFAALPVVAGLPGMHWLFLLTYPWLSDDRPREISVILASVLAAGGLVAIWRWIRGQTWQPQTVRRVGLAFVLLIGFFAEGSSVSIYKRLLGNIEFQDSFSADDAAAMAWLKYNADSDALVINDGTADAGIWLPYKADVPILLPRSASGSMVSQRGPVLDHTLDLNSDPTARQRACSLHADYVYVGARPLSFEERQLGDRQALEGVPYLKEVFSSGEAAVFEIELPCANGEGASNR